MSRAALERFAERLRTSLQTLSAISGQLFVSLIAWFSESLNLSENRRRSSFGDVVGVLGMKGSNSYVIENSGSRRSSAERREEILVVALSVLAEHGYGGASMREIAGRAKASKETLYAWFGDKRGLFEELVRWQAERVGDALAPSLERDAADVSEVLRGFAVELQRLLLGDRAVVINRAAISEATTDPTFARALAAQGRDSIVPKLERYLEEQRERGCSSSRTRGGGGPPHRVGHRRPAGPATARVMPMPSPNRSKRAPTGRWASSFPVRRGAVLPGAACRRRPEG